jgi:hypothetical protein
MDESPEIHRWRLALKRILKFAGFKVQGWGMFGICICEPVSIRCYGCAVPRTAPKVPLRVSE